MRILVIAAIIAAVAPAYAEVFPNKEAGVSIDIPKDWKKTGSGSSVAISDPKEEAVLMLITSEGADMKKAGDALDAQLAKVMKDIKWSPQKEITHNTMKGIAIKGTAKINDKAVDIAALILVTPTKKGLFVVGAVQSNKLAAHKAEVDGIVNSIKPLK
jgi:hypothetical protein